MSSEYPSYGGMQSLACQRCQAPLIPNEANCRNCGYYNAVPVQTPAPSNSSWGDLTASQSQRQSRPPSWGQFPVSPTVPPAMPSLPAQNVASNPPSNSLRSFFNTPAMPSSPMQSNGYGAYNITPPDSAMTPPAFVPQQPPGTPPTGPITQAAYGAPPTGPITQAAYGTPPTGSISQPYGMPATSPTGQTPYGMPPTGPVSQAAYGAPSTGPIAQALYGMPATGPTGQTLSGQTPYGTPPSGFQQFGAYPGSGQQFSGTGPFDFARTQSDSLQPFTAGQPTAAESPRFTQPASSVRRPKPLMMLLLLLLLVILLGGGFISYKLLNNHTVGTPTSVAPGGAPKGAPLFADTFKNNAKGWSLQADPHHFSISLAANALVLEDDNNELLWEPVPGNKTYGDFTLSVDAMLARGDQTNGYGIYIRGSSVQNAEMATYYRFELYGDGSYAIFKGTVDANDASTSSKLVDYTASAAIQKQGTINHITITAKGPTMSLTVNGQLLKTITDSSYVNGTIAPFVSNMQNAKPGAQAKFANLAIYPA